MSWRSASTWTKVGLSGIIKTDNGSEVDLYPGIEITFSISLVDDEASRGPGKMACTREDLYQ